VDTRALAAFLRARRDRLTPRDVGLPDGERRRTAGLRRQEVAQLAGISVDYYVRLEQARGPRPSRQVLGALARALMLSRDERDYLFRLVGEAAPTTSGPSTDVVPAIRHLLDSLHAVPAYVVDAKYDVLAWNDLAVHFIGDLARVSATDRNMVRWTFRRPADDLLWTDAEMIAFTRATVADLRAAYGRYPDDPGIAALVTELLGTSPRFAEMWRAHDVAVRRRITKRVHHPDVGQLEFTCQVLHVDDTDQRIIAYLAEPGSPTAQVFARLATASAGAGSTAGPLD
jgi:transcriptional regulator with XRE-family HTH domain